MHLSIEAAGLILVFGAVLGMCAGYAMRGDENRRYHAARQRACAAAVAAPAPAPYRPALPAPRPMATATAYRTDIGRSHRAVTAPREA